MRLGLRIFPALLWLAFLLTAAAKEVIPPPPRAYVNDAAGILDPEAARRLNARLEAFERETSNQIVVAIYPRMESNSSIEDYTVRVAQAWGVGQKDRRNGAVLFAFIENRSLFIQVGYGLEGALPDIACKQIIENEILPRFREGDYTAGIEAGANAMMAATRGEYAGQPRAPSGRSGGSIWVPLLLFFALYFLFHFINKANGRRGGRGYSGRGPVNTGGWGGWSGGGGGGGFRGGGGSFGGGGAGGRW